jgi:hypothetical protein
MPEQFGDCGPRFAVGLAIRGDPAAHRWRDAGDVVVLVSCPLVAQPVTAGADKLAGNADLGQYTVVVRRVGLQRKAGSAQVLAGPPGTVRNESTDRRRSIVQFACSTAVPAPVPRLPSYGW